MQVRTEWQLKSILWRRKICKMWRRNNIDRKKREIMQPKNFYFEKYTSDDCKVLSILMLFSRSFSLSLSLSIIYYNVYKLSTKSLLWNRLSIAWLYFDFYSAVPNSQIENFENGLVDNVFFFLTIKSVHGGWYETKRNKNNA